MDKKILLEMKQRAHALKPVVLLGANGLTAAVLREIDAALESHELIKIRVNADTREDRQQMTEEICQKLQATFIQQVGHIITVYRKSRDA